MVHCLGVYGCEARKGPRFEAFGVLDLMIQYFRVYGLGFRDQICDAKP